MNHQSGSAAAIDFTSLAVPGPNPTALSAPFWSAAAEGRLVLQRCRACSRFAAYPREICPFCWSEDLAWEEVSGLAEVQTFTRVHRAGNAGWQVATPFVVALVRLAEGPVLLTQLLGVGNGLRRGAACHMVQMRVADWTLPFFRLIGEGTLDSTNGRIS
jgi:uncharacterized OB-fold protein